MGKVFLTDISDTVALREKLKSSDQIPNYLSILDLGRWSAKYQSQFLGIFCFFGGFLTDTSDMVALLEMLKSLDPNYFSIVGLHCVLSNFKMCIFSHFLVGPTNIPMWILDSVDAPLWANIGRAFTRHPNIYDFGIALPEGLSRMTPKKRQRKNGWKY